MNNSTSFQLILESKIKKFNKFIISGKFGIGITVINDPSVWLENSNESFGFNTNYKENTDKNFSFLDLSANIGEAAFCQSNPIELSLSMRSCVIVDTNSAAVTTETNVENCGAFDATSTMSPDAAKVLTWANEKLKSKPIKNIVFILFIMIDFI